MTVGDVQEIGRTARVCHEPIIWVVAVLSVLELGPDRSLAPVAAGRLRSSG